MPEAGERVTRLKEAVQILRGLFDNECFSYEGKYWKLDDAYNVPQPIQRPMRISVGARQPRMISIAAKYGDGMNGSGNLYAIRGYLKHLEPELEKNNRKMRDFYLSGFANVTITKTGEEAEAIYKKITKDKSIEDVRGNEFVGTAEDLIEKFRVAQDMGVKMMIVIPRANKIPELKEYIAKLRDEVFHRL